MNTWIAGDPKVVRSACNGCHCECGVLVHVKDGRVVKIEGDPQHPQSEGIMCPKGLALTQQLHHPDRLKYPLKRIGERGEGKWERMSWDEALNLIVDKTKETVERHGPQAIAFGVGDGDRDNQPHNLNLLILLGSPNLIHHDAHYCLSPQMTASEVTFGDSITWECGPDFKNSMCILLWGANIFHAHLAFGKNILKASRNGAKLIVVDPRFTSTAAKADIWLQIRPQTDCALALGMLNVILEEELYDKEFVEKWCHGFDKLNEHVEKYPPDKVAEITWVPKEKILKAARTYAALKPASLYMRMGVTMGSNALQTCRAISLLIAITGNVDVKGGNLIPVWDKRPIGLLDVARQLQETLPKEVIIQRAGGEKFPMQCGPEGLNFAFGGECHSPIAYLEQVGKTIKLMWIHNDPVSGYEDVKLSIEALRRLEFLVVTDFFMTPTAMLADIVLPAAMWPERDLIHDIHYYNSGIVCGAGPKVVEPIAECRDERWIAAEITKRLGLESGTFIPLDIEEYLDWRLKPLGLSWEQLKLKHVYKMPIKYGKYKRGGFRTPTGKVELYSTTLEKYGYDPLPSYKEPPESPYSSPDLAEEYPYILLAGGRFIAFYHSAHRQIPWLRELCPEPIMEIHPETAARHGIEDGEWVWVETSRKKGERAKFKAKLTLGIHPKVVFTQSHWWFPEKRDVQIGEVLESNINVTLSKGPPYDPVTGSTFIRGVLCKIHKVS